MSLHSRDDWSTAIVQFEGSVIQAYQNGDAYGTDKCMFSGRAAGETWNIPVTVPSVAVNEEDGQDVIAAAGAYKALGLNDPITNNTLTVDPPLKDIRLIPLDQIEVRPDLQLPDTFAKMLGRSLAEGKHIRIQNMLANAAGANSVNVLTSEPTEATLLADLNNALETIAAAFDENGVPSTGRHIMMKSTLWYKLLKIAGVYTKEYGGEASVRRPGEYIEWANFAIHNGKVGFGVDYTASPWDARFLSGGASTNDTLQYEYNATDLLAVAWHEEAWALRHWVEPTVLWDWMPQYDAYKMEARLTMGCTDVQTDGLYIIEDGT